MTSGELGVTIILAVVSVGILAGWIISAIDESHNRRMLRMREPTSGTVMDWRDGMRGEAEADHGPRSISEMVREAESIKAEMDEELRCAGSARDELGGRKPAAGSTSDVSADSRATLARRQSPTKLTVRQREALAEYDRESERAVRERNIRAVK